MQLLLEHWRDVVGYEGRYEVSSHGRVWSQLTKRIMRPSPNSRGYLTVTLNDGSRPKRPHSFCVHTLVALAFLGPRPAGHEVDHGPKGKLCNEVTNLEYVTPVENVRRAAHLVTRYKGAANVNAKLSAAQVKEVRSLEGTMPRYKIAILFGVSDRTIASVLARQSYKEVI